jgi:hypothetical protein
MAYPLPPEIHITSHREQWALLFPVAAIAVVALTAIGATAVFGDEVLEAAGVEPDWTGPLLGIGGMVGLGLAVWAAIMIGSRAMERHQVRRVYRNALARWPQYATEAQWRQVIEKDSRPDGNWLETAIPAGILTAVIAAIAVPAGFQRMWSMVTVLAAFWLLLLGLVAGRRWNQRREQRADRRRRERLAPFPACVLSAEGFYHEDWGLVEIDNVTDVRVIPASEVPGLRKQVLGQARAGEIDLRLEPLDSRLARSGWSLLQLTLDSRVKRTLWDQLGGLLSSDHQEHRDPMPVSVLHVRVPPGREAEAGQVVTLLRTRWLASAGTPW